MSKSIEKQLNELRKLMALAIQVELSTIPPYATAAYTISQAGQYDQIMPLEVNAEPLEVIRQVMVEEMLHLALAANILNAIGGEVNLPETARGLTYPRHLLPQGHGPVLHLRKFTKDQVHSFREVERAPPNFERVKGGNCLNAETIGGFYHCVKERLIKLCAEANEAGVEIFTGDPALQVGPEHYWGAGGELMKVHCADTALTAIDLIVEEGEGGGQGDQAGDGDPIPGTDEMDIAHFFKFNEILLSRYYQADDRLGSPPTGKDLVVDWDAVFPMKDDPTPDAFADLPEVHAKMMAFNETYTQLVDHLQQAFSGRPDELRRLGPVMMDLRYRAQALVRIPVDRSGATAGPSWTYLG